VSAATGIGVEALRDQLGRLAFGDRGTGESSLALNARHVRCVDDARSAAADARASAAAGEGAELIAHHLRGSLDALGAVLGAVTPDDVLGRIFSSFCIGK
jgi:tRNA modification GTPase